MDLAIDMGGTNIRAEVSKIGLHVKSFHAKTSEVGLASWIEFILQEYPRIKTIGISYAGQVNDGVIISSPNIIIEKHDIKKYFEEHYNVSLFIENDLSCAVLAEADYYQSNNICSLYVGTGLGLGVFEQGKLYRGASNIAAELGHIPYKETPLVCGCGRKNCMELYVSGAGIQKWSEYYNWSHGVTLDSLKMSENPKENELLKEFETALLYACGTTITLYNPEILVLGGGIIEANPYLVDLVKRRLQEFALPQALSELKIVQSELSNAPMVGALLLKDYHG